MLRRLVLLTSLAWCTGAAAQLPAPVSQALAAGNMPEDAISVLVLRGNDILLAHRTDRPMNPASAMKLVTTAVALEQLGPTFRGRTELRSNGVQVRDVLKGDLVLRGGADIDFSGEVLERMLRSLRNQGIRQIDGALVFDRQLFNPARLDINAPPFDENTDAYTNVIPDALMVNKNMLEIDLRSDGTRVALDMQPALDGVDVVSGMTLVDADCASWENGWKAPQVAGGKNSQLRVVLSGTYPRNCARTARVNVLDRHDYLDRLVRSTWRRLGGSITGLTVEAAGPADSRLLAEHQSRALPEIIRDYNKTSDNTLARTVFLSLGSLEFDAVLGSRALPANGEPTLARADAAVRNWMRGKGIDDSALVLENGSGLSRIERITAAQLAGVLQAVERSNWAPEFQASLPIAAVDGTMRRRLGDSPAAQRARTKTGTLRNVMAVAGYVKDANGQQCIVVGIINSELIGGGKGRAVLDALIDWTAKSY